MVRPTKERGVVPFRVNAIFGWDPGEVGAIVDTTPPVDRVVDAVVEMAIAAASALVQEAIGTRSTGAGTPTAVLGATPTEGNTLIAIVGQRGIATTTGALSGFTKVGQAATDSFDGGVVAVYYREVAAPGETDTYAYTASSSANIYVAELSGVGAFVDDATASAVAASASLAASGSVGTGDLLAFAAFAHAVRDGTGSGGVAPDYGWPVGWTREVNAGIDPSGPSVTMAWQQLTGHTGSLAVSGITATNSGTYGWLLATFAASDRAWQLAPETQDDDDATYRAFDIDGAFWRAMLDDAYVAGTARAFIGFDTSASRTIELEGATEADFSDAVVLDSVTLTSTGSYTGDEFDFTIATPGAYQFYRLVGSGAYDGRVYTVELFDFEAAGAEVVQAALDDHIADPTDAHDASAVSILDTAALFAGATVEAALEALARQLFGISVHGSMGATETLDASVAGYHTGTLNADATITLDGFTSGVLGEILFRVTEDGTGGHTPTFTPTPTWIGGTPTHDETAGTSTVYGFWSEDGGTVVYGYQAGGGGSVGALDDLSDVTITAAAENDTLRRIGSAWANDNRRWEPVTDNPGSGPDMVFDGDDLVMEWGTY
jgi:hypothetical protein